MKYLGIVKAENGMLVMPDAFREMDEGRSYEAIEVGGDIVLMSAPLDRARLARIVRLADRSIEDHRATLERLAK